MKIFVLTSEYPNNRNPQASIFVHEQCKELKKLGHNVIVLDPSIVVPAQWFDYAVWNVVKRKLDNITIYTHYTPGLATTKLLTLNQALYVKRMIKLYSYVMNIEGKPDVLYAHFATRAGVAACEIGNHENIPVVVIEHGGAVMNKQYSPFLSKWLKYVSLKSNALICVSEFQKRHIERYIGKLSKIIVIPNMISDDYSFAKPTVKDKFVFFSAGNLYKVKRMDILINAFGNSFTNNDKVVLRIAGDGIEKDNLLRIIRERGLNDRITLLGRCDKTQMLKEYISCNAFVLASEHESFGIAYREAMAVGRPIVATDNGGIREGWEDNFGKIVPVNDEKALGMAMRYIYENFRLYDLDLISKKCRYNYSAKIIIRRVEGVLLKSIDMNNTI